MNSINLVPQKLMFFANTIMQEYTGDVTIFPKLYLSDLFKLLDLNRNMVLNQVKRGRNYSFFYMNHIIDSMRIEKKLKEICEELQAK